MSDVIPNIFLKNQADNEIDFVSDTMKVALLSGTYDEFTLRDTSAFNVIEDNEISGMYGYSTGGYTVTGITVTLNSDDNSVVYDIDDVGGTVSGGTLGPVRYGVMYDITNDGSLVYIFDFGEDLTVNDGAQFKIQIDTNGLMKSKQGTLSS